MVDVTGSPLQVSGVVQYYFNKSKRTALQAQNPESLVHDLASATLKRIVSRYPYEAPEGEHSLKTEANEIGEEFCAELQKKVEVAGAKIVGFSFNEMSYAPEVASGMLKRQQAGALIQARRLIVDGAVSIVSLLPPPPAHTHTHTSYIHDDTEASLTPATQTHKYVHRRMCSYTLMSALVRTHSFSTLQARTQPQGRIVARPFSCTPYATAPCALTHIVCRDGSPPCHRFFSSFQTSDAIEGLASKGIHMGEEDKARLVSNLLTALCSESNVAPVLPLGSRY